LSFMYRLRRSSYSALFPYTTLFRSMVWSRTAWGLGQRALVQAGKLPKYLYTQGNNRFQPLFERGPADGENGRFHGGKSAEIQGKDRKSTRLNSSHVKISYAVFCLKK